MPLQSTSGAASYDGFGGGVAAVPKYIEDYFSTFLYSGNGANRSINNGIDLSTKGGMVWFKARNVGSNHYQVDTARGNTKYLASNSTTSQMTFNDALTAFTTTGFNLGVDAAAGDINGSGYEMASWSIAKAPKFFDVVTYTGNGTNGRTVAHNLGSAPGCIIIKRTSFTGPWYTWHRSLTADKVVYLNTTAAQADPPFGAGSWISSDSTTVTFPNVSIADVNNNGYDYVMYIFAHNAGGFGLTGTDNVISCGSFSFSSGKATVNLGYEPQYLLLKRTSGAEQWWVFDTMRGMTASLAGNNYLTPNSSVAEADLGSITQPTATGFYLDWSNNGITTGDYIYIAIRRGPMKVPTDATKVFNALSRTGTAATATVSTTILPDLVMSQARGGMYNVFYDRLRGTGATLSPNLGTDAESVVTNGITAFNNTSYTVGSDASQNRINWNTYTYANWLFSRAPSFFDVVCYTGTGTSSRNISHNLTVQPEFVIVKSRSATGQWVCFVKTGTNTYVVPNSAGASSFGFALTNAGFSATDPDFNTIYFTSSTFNPVAYSFSADTNASGVTYVAYLFATCAGVSKVFSYTGNGSSQTINCGFTSGARWILIKRTDSTGDWYVWDSARGIVSGNDPHLSLNTTAAEVTTDDSVDTDSTGFIVNQLSATNINVSSATYIGIAIA